MIITKILKYSKDHIADIILEIFLIIINIIWLCGFIHDDIMVVVTTVLWTMILSKNLFIEYRRRSIKKKSN